MEEVAEPTLTRHAYLGEVDDLQVHNGVALLECGVEHHLPLIVLPGVVLMPGDNLPLQFSHPDRQLRVIQGAVSAPAPYKGLLVVVCKEALVYGHQMVACVAELRQAKIRPHASSTCLATGRQRCEIRRTEASGKAWVVLVEDAGQLEAPREGLAGSAALAPWVYRTFDPGRLARAAGQAFSEALPLVHQQRGDPCMLSYWLSGNLPAGWQTKQWLLAAPNASTRLTMLLSFLKELDGLCCGLCGTKIVSLKDIFRPAGQDCGNIFVNSRGFNHDMLSAMDACNMELQGQPSEEFSWFPGYAWTPASCESCGIHLGWKFTAVYPSLQPPAFWGIASRSVEGIDRLGDPMEDSDMTISEYYQE